MEQQGGHQEQAAGPSILNPPKVVVPSKDHVLEEKPQNGIEDSKGVKPPSATEDEEHKQEAEATDGATTTQGQPPASTAAGQVNQEASSNTGDNSTPADSNATQQPPAAAPSASQETNSTTPASTENTTSEAPTTTPSTVPNAGINTIASTTVQKNKANVDSSVIPVWMRTAAPLLIVAVLVSATVY
ncbi:uncharacterized protein TM35_000961110 [Trypanosoma theileri]|uniref:Uncharacterized protein n=1 Tax=Trypanosoma theileri TaxID=67003 RepID=A0A1X0NFU8_9TRYP|nr:uncharacterized protein TM35_000961110 [Trypanosoma theileri]ORC82232.1 hypothetical protein TM35_000961110 [Trypanosoma theileri]